MALSESIKKSPMDILKLKNVIYRYKNSKDWFSSRWDTTEDNIHWQKDQYKGPKMTHRKKRTGEKDNRKVLMLACETYPSPTSQHAHLPLAPWLAQELACESGWCNRRLFWNLSLSHKNEMLSFSLNLNLTLRYLPEAFRLVFSQSQERKVTEFYDIIRDLGESYISPIFVHIQFYAQIFPFLL